MSRGGYENISIIIMVTMINNRVIKYHHPFTNLYLKITSFHN